LSPFASINLRLILLKAHIKPRDAAYQWAILVRIKGTAY
jgi:hypothetical protein